MSMISVTGGDNLANLFGILDTPEGKKQLAKRAADKGLVPPTPDQFIGLGQQQAATPGPIVSGGISGAGAATSLNAVPSAPSPGLENLFLGFNTAPQVPGASFVAPVRSLGALIGR